MWADGPVMCGYGRWTPPTARSWPSTSTCSTTPETFRRDKDAWDVGRADIKLCDMMALRCDRLLILERVSATAKLYIAKLDTERGLSTMWADPHTRLTLEKLSSQHALDWPVVDKHLLFSTGDHPEIGPDLEGLTLLDDRTILLVNDNDFGDEGAATRFWRVELETSIEGT